VQAGGDAADSAGNPELMDKDEKINTKQVGEIVKIIKIMRNDFTNEIRGKLAFDEGWITLKKVECVMRKQSTIVDRVQVKKFVQYVQINFSMFGIVEQP